MVYHELNIKEQYNSTMDYDNVLCLRTKTTIYLLKETILW